MIPLITHRIDGEMISGREDLTWGRRPGKEVMTRRAIGNTRPMLLEINCGSMQLYGGDL